MGSTVSFEPRFGPQLESLVNPIGSVKRHPDNPYKHPPKQLVKIQQSLQAHGQQTPLTVQRSTGYIVKGNGTHEAAEKMGWDRIAYHVVDMDDQQAWAYLVADNEASRAQERDVAALSRGLRKLQDGPGLQGTLFDEEELADLDEVVFGATTVDPGQFTGAFAPDDRPEERAQREATPGTKMKEVPVVLTLEEHQLFVSRLHRVAGALGTKGTIATLVRLTEWAAGHFEGREKALPPANAAEVRVETLRELVLHYDDIGKQYVTGETVANHLQGLLDAARQQLPKAPVKELPGQMRVDDVLPSDLSPVEDEA